jgi:hypothetical protein
MVALVLLLVACSPTTENKIIRYHNCEEEEKPAQFVI